MITINGYWFDGKTSSQTDARMFVFGSGGVRIERSEDGEVLSSTLVSEMDVSARISDIPRYIYFPNGGKFETDDNDTIDSVLNKYRPSRFHDFIHRLENRKRYIISSLLAVIIFGFFMVKYGAPITAKIIAAHLPQSIFNYADEKTILIMDKGILSPSELKEDEQIRIREYFQSFINDNENLSLKILFRKGGHIGANAFALPSGTIIFTDEMVKISDKHEELLAIFAHETGHVLHRHGIRTLIQDSLLAFAIAAIIGDASGTAEILLGLPIILTEMAYSRTFENEADQYALDSLQAWGICPNHFSNLMRRIMEKRRGKRQERKDSGNGQKINMIINYLSTHPSTERRIEIFRKATDSENCT